MSFLQLRESVALFVLSLLLFLLIKHDTNWATFNRKNNNVEVQYRRKWYVERNKHDLRKRVKDVQYRTSVDTPVIVTSDVPARVGHACCHVT